MKLRSLSAAGLALSLAITLCGSAQTVRAAQPGGRKVTVTVTVDTAVYRIRQQLLLEAAVREALEPPKDIEVVGGANGARAYVDDPAGHAAFTAAVAKRFEHDPRVSFEVSPTRIFHIGFSPAGLASMQPKSAMAGMFPTAEHAKTLASMEGYIRLLRPPMPGIDIEDQIDGAIIHAHSPAEGEKALAAIQAGSGLPANIFKFQRVGDASWRATLDFDAAVGPIRTRLLAARVGAVLRESLREPLDLKMERDNQGLAVIVANPAAYSKFVDRLVDAFADQPDFTLTQSEGRLYEITSVEGESKPQDLSGPSPLMQVLEDIADPPVRFIPTDAGVTVRAADPANNAERAAVLRGSFSGRSDLILSNNADQSVSVRYASDVSPLSAISDERLLRAVRLSVDALSLKASNLHAAGNGRIAVEFATEHDADAFRAGAVDGPGLQFRLVDEDSVGKTPASAPSPDDERLPAEYGGYLWLRPGAVISGDMVTAARVTLDSQRNQPIIFFTLTDEGARLLTAMTADNIGKRFAFVVDGKVLSAPVIQSKIGGGSGEINGNFTLESAAAQAKAILEHSYGVPLKIDN